MPLANFRHPEERPAGPRLEGRKAAVQPGREPLSIYIHWPFCKSKCPYCDFNSHVREGVDHTRWKNALLHELSHYQKLLPDREIVSIFFGGGTPSLMETSTAASLIESVAKHWQMA